jgi:hypothetical protein
MSRWSFIVVCVGFFAASLIAQQAPPSASSRALSRAKATGPDPGQISNGVYHNSLFGFTYKLPYGWVDRTEDMREGSDDSEKPADSSKALVLLAIFERPPEARGDTVNSSIVIAAESVASYPGLKSAAQYFGPLAEVTSQQGLKATGEPYEFPLNARSLARCDYAKPMGGITLHQSTLAVLAKGYVVSFTFVGQDEDGLNSLIENLAFAKIDGPSRK